MIKKLLLASLVFSTLTQHAVADGAGPIVGTGSYVVTVDEPTYKKGTGPRVVVDEAHYNYQTIDDRFKGFADLMVADGERVSPSHEQFSAKSLAQADVLVICNALSKINAEEKAAVNKWRLPAPEAFTDDEIKAVDDWVKAGGSLLLIADHMPFPQAADKMGGSFGVVMGSNFAFDASFTYKPGDMNLIKFYREQPSPRTGKLLPHVIVEGSKPSQRIPYVVTFTGNGFRMKPGVDFTPIFELGEGSMIAWPFDHEDISVTTPFTGGAGLYQGVVMHVGKGRVAVFGEASMWSVNWADWWKNYPLGFQNPEAQYNKQFTLNVIHWLSKELN